MPRSSAHVAVSFDLAASLLPLLDRSLDAFVLLGSDDRVTYCNRAAAALLQLDTPGQMLGLDPGEISSRLGVRIEPLHEWQSAFDLCKRERRTISAEVQLTTRHGARTDIDAQLVNIGTDSTPRVLMSFRNLTERLRATRAKMAAMQVDASLLEAIPTAMAVRDRDGRYVRVNAAHSELFGQDASFYEGKIWSQIQFDPRDARGRTPATIEALRQAGGYLNREIVVYTSNGERRLVSSAARLVLTDDGTELSVCSYVDLTHLRELEVTEARARENLEHLARSLPIALYRARFDEHALSPFLYVSEAFESVWGVSCELALEDPTHVYSRIHPDDRAEMKERLRQAVVHMGPYQQDVRVQAEPGRYRWLHLSSLPHLERDGSVVFSGYVRDIDSEKPRALPDASKVESSRMALDNVEFDLDDVFDDLMTLMSERAVAKGLTLRLDLSPDLPERLLGDPRALEQVLLNLVANAIKFTEHGGVRVHVRCIDETADQVRLHFEVEDTGIGIPSEQVQNLFQGFVRADVSTTRKYGGAGLGLSICKSLVEMMNGSIYVKSQPGRGSLFDFTAQFHKVRPRRARQPAEARGLWGKGSELDRETALGMATTATDTAEPPIVGKLTRLLREGSYDAIELVRMHTTSLQAWLGERALAFQTAVAAFDFERAASLLRGQAPSPPPPDLPVPM